MPRNFFTGTDSLLYSGSNNFNSIISVDYADYGVSLLESQQYTTLNTAYGTAYNASITPATKGTASRLARNEARKPLVALAQRLAKIIAAQPGMTPEQLYTLGLTVPKNPAPVPMPALAPGLEIKSNIGRLVRVKISNPNDPSRRSKPNGMVGVNLFTFIGTEQPESASDYELQGMSSRTYVDILFPETVPSGATVWICGSWVSRRGDIGISSTPFSFNIQGGTVGVVGTVGSITHSRQSKKAA